MIGYRGPIRPAREFRRRARRDHYSPVFQRLAASENRNHSLRRRHKHLPACRYGRGEICSGCVDASAIDYFPRLRIYAGDNPACGDHVHPTAILERRSYFGNTARLRPLESCLGEGAFSCGSNRKQPSSDRSASAPTELTYGGVFCFVYKTILVAIDPTEEEFDSEMRSGHVLRHAGTLAKIKIVGRRPSAALSFPSLSVSYFSSA